MQAVQVRPDLIYPYLGLGHVQLRQANYAAALSWYERADRAQLGSHWPAHFAGQVYFDTGDLAAALERFLQAERESPGMIWNQYYLARTLDAMGQAPEALVYVDGKISDG